MNDEQIEQEIQDKGLTAPRVTPEDVEASIAMEFYFSAEHGVEGAMARGELWARDAAGVVIGPAMAHITLCVIIMRNGHKIVGVNTGSVSDANFDGELDRRNFNMRDRAILIRGAIQAGFPVRTQLSAWDARQHAAASTSGPDDDLAQRSQP